LATVIRTIKEYTAYIYYKVSVCVKKQQKTVCSSVYVSNIKPKISARKKNKGGGGFGGVVER